VTRADFIYLLALQYPGASPLLCLSCAGLTSDVKELTASATPRAPSFSEELDRLCSLAMAAGKDYNDELTFILNHAEVSLNLIGPDHPAGAHLVELTHAALRCAETARCLLVLTENARDSLRYAKVRTGHAHPRNRKLL